MHYVLFLEFLQGHEKTKDGSGSKVIIMMSYEGIIVKVFFSSK